MLCDIQLNWGPRPFRMFKSLGEFDGYYGYVNDNWNVIQVSGWGGFVLKKKNSNY